MVLDKIRPVRASVFLNAAKYTDVKHTIWWIWTNEYSHDREIPMKTEFASPQQCLGDTVPFMHSSLFILSRCFHSIFVNTPKPSTPYKPINRSVLISSWKLRWINLWFTFQLKSFCKHRLFISLEWCLSLKNF